MAGGNVGYDHSNEFEGEVWHLVEEKTPVLSSDFVTYFVTGDGRDEGRISTCR